MPEVEEPTLEGRVGCALYVLAWGPEYPGDYTKRRLMWPHTVYTDDDVRRAAAKLLASVCTELLEAVPQARRRQISIGQAEYLSFVLGDALPGDTSLSGAAGSPRQARPG